MSNNQYLVHIKISRRNFMNARRLRCGVAFVLGVVFFCSQLVFAVEPSVSILGDVFGSGKAEMKTAFDRWVPVSGKTFPVIDGANLRSGKGMMSLIFRDSVRMEVGKNSEVVVSGSRGNYTIELNKGQVAFSVPQGISFSVKTPTSTIQTKAPGMIQKVSMVSQNDTKGVVTYDGKGTRITSLNGTLSVRSGLGLQVQTVSAGNALYIEGKDSGNVRNVVLGGEPPAKNDEKDSTPFYVTGIGAAVVTSAYFGINDLYHPTSFR